MVYFIGICSSVQSDNSWALDVSHSDGPDLKINTVRCQLYYVLHGQIRPLRILLLSHETLYQPFGTELGSVEFTLDAFQRAASSLGHVHCEHSNREDGQTAEQEVSTVRRGG